MSSKCPQLADTAAARSALDELLAVENVPPLDFDQPTLYRLVERIDAAPLFAHFYTFYFHLHDEVWGPDDLLTFAADQGLKGVKCHPHVGGRGALYVLSPERRRALGARARELGLRWHVEVSSTEERDLATAVAVATDLDAESIRCYPRYSGRVSEILPRVIEDLRRFSRELDPARRFRLTVEQHEDLTSREMVQLVESVDDPRITLLFDFTNMVVAGERPVDALAVQAPWVTDVHLKDARILPDRGGWAQLCCRTGTGDIPVARLLAELLLLGEHEPQVHAIGLQEEVNYFAPAYRFPDDPPDPVIPPREPGTTAPLPNVPAPLLRADELRYAQDQVVWVRDLLDRMRGLAKAVLGEPTAMPTPDGEQPRTPFRERGAGSF
ncbi:MAG: TIM barrel protein [Alphaproteobacteria bacterium]